MAAVIEQIILATSGSLNCGKAEEYAVSLSNKLQKPLHIIHVTDTRMAMYGAIEPLAPELCSKQFSKYIIDQTEGALNNVLKRVKYLEAMSGIAISFHNLQGDPVKTIQKFILQQKEKTALIIGKEKNKQKFFRVKPNLSKEIKKCVGRHVHVYEI